MRRRGAGAKADDDDDDDDDDDGVGGCLSNYTVEVDQPRARRHKTVDLSMEVIGLDVKGSEYICTVRVAIESTRE